MSEKGAQGFGWGRRPRAMRRTSYRVLAYLVYRGHNRRRWRGECGCASELFPVGGCRVTGVERLDPDRLPRHVGIILDGNGRWAEQRGLHRTAGHAAGEKALFEAIQGALEVGIEWLTVYTFSTENWSRSEEEVAFLMHFNQDLLLRRRDDLHADGVRIYFMGDLDDPRIPDLNKTRMREAQEVTAANQRLNLVFAFNYGSRLELAEAARRLAGDALAGHLDLETIESADSGLVLLHPRDARRRPHHPHFRRTPAEQFLALAGRLRGVRVPRGSVPRFHAGTPG